jgi:Co/Zn/Cd efflux system component
VGVVIASIIIYFFRNVDGITIADPICTYIFSVIVVQQSFPTIKQCLHVLMEGAP